MMRMLHLYVYQHRSTFTTLQSRDVALLSASSHRGMEVDVSDSGSFLGTIEVGR